MSWQGQISTMVRHIINDVDSASYKYSIQRMETTILVAAQLVSQDLDFINDYVVNVESCSLSPDPTDSPKDNAFINLTSLKTACVIIGSEVRSEASNAISIKDGPSAIDLRGVSSTLNILYKDLCSKYEQLTYDYVAGGSLAGQAILGPYSPGSDFVARGHNDYNSRGGYFSY
tara:strand:+ start:2175 stop:2693 length:519 start_codon:yes stop_codon:yes gene_type:complete